MNLIPGAIFSGHLCLSDGSECFKYDYCSKKSFDYCPGTSLHTKFIAYNALLLIFYTLGSAKESQINHSKVLSAISDVLESYCGCRDSLKYSTNSFIGVLPC